MTSRRALFPIVAGIVGLLILIFVVFRFSGDDAADEPMTGDVDEMVSGLETSELPDQARAFLTTDRPWRAARTMDRYLEATDDPEPDHLVLAARARGGWGAWDRTLDLLASVPALDTYQDGIGLYLLGRARDEDGDAAGAVESYRAFLAFSPPPGSWPPSAGPPGSGWRWL
jgi:hypothetical protein